MILRRLLVVAVSVSLLGACLAGTELFLEPDTEQTIACVGSAVVSVEVLSAESTVVRCDGNTDTQQVVHCNPHGKAVVEALDAQSVKVKCPTGTTTTTTTTSTSTTVAPTTTSTVVPSRDGMIWHGDADTDTDHGAQTDCLDKNTQNAPLDRLSISPDPLDPGNDVYRAELTAADIAAGNKRAEWKDPYAGCDGATEVFLWQGVDRTRYIGWRSMFGGAPTLNGADNGGNYLQWKGDSTCGGPAVGMTISDNDLTLRTLDGPDPSKPEWPGAVVWHGPEMIAMLDGQWHDMVMAVHFSKTAGWIEWTVDGVPQTMTNGQLRWEGPTVCPNDTEVWTKWGVYGMDSGNPIHWVDDPRIGTSFEQVTP